MLEKARSKAVRSVSPEPSAEGDKESVRGICRGSPGDRP